MPKFKIVLEKIFASRSVTPIMLTDGWCLHLDYTSSGARTSTGGSQQLEVVQGVSLQVVHGYPRVRAYTHTHTRHTVRQLVSLLYFAQLSV